MTAPGQCEAVVEVPLVLDDYDGPTPQSFPCRLLAGHEPAPHEAIVTWLDGEDD